MDEETYRELYDNMTVIERRFYGTGVNDYGQLVKVHSYHSRPANQYSSTNEDSGSKTEIRYDWHMRPVWVTRYGEGPDFPILGHSIMWYDHLGRTIIQAEFGAGQVTLP